MANFYRPNGQKEKIDPILGVPVDKIKDMYTQKKVNTISKPVSSSSGSSGLGMSEDLLAKAQKAQQYNQDNKYKVSGLNISNRTGDTIGRIFDQLLK